MKKNQQKPKVYLMFQEKSKSQKKSSPITRCKLKESPKIRNKTLSVYKIDKSKKQYAGPINEEENNLQFWACTKPPKRIKVRNPYKKEQQKSNEKDVTGRTSTLLKKYIQRKNVLSKRNFLISTEQMSTVCCPSIQLQKSKNKILFNDSKTWDARDSLQLDKKFFSSTMISEHEEMQTQPCVENFKPIRKNVFLQKILELRQKISSRANVLTQLKKNMDGIHLKKLIFVD